MNMERSLFVILFLFLYLCTLILHGKQFRCLQVQTSFVIICPGVVLDNLNIYRYGKSYFFLFFKSSKNKNRLSNSDCQIVSHERIFMYEPLFLFSNSEKKLGQFLKVNWVEYLLIHYPQESYHSSVSSYDCGISIRVSIISGFSLNSRAPSYC